LLGVIGALSAKLFVFLVDFGDRLFLGDLAGYHITPPGLPPVPISWLIVVAPTVGGLLAGILVYSLAPEAEGHGTDTVVRSFHHQAGHLRARIPPIKMVASAITIGSGGAAGREGPTALIAAGVGSVYAQLGRRPNEEQRLLLLMSMAAGLSAVFRSPIGTAVFAVEVLYSGMEFETRALLFTLVAAVVAYAGDGFLVGWKPLFHVPLDLSVSDPLDFLWYAALGLAAGALGTVIPSIFYGMRDAFRRIPIPDMFKPAIGGFGVGLIALLLPQVLGGGYAWIQRAINGQMAMNVLPFLVIAKVLALALTIGSGGSGGVFAPTLYVGAMLGAFLSHISGQPPAAFAVIGMAAVFASAARVPIASLLMVTEMTGGYGLLAPAALAVATSYLLQRTVTTGWRYVSLYEGQVPGLVESPVHHEHFLRGAFHLLRDKGVELPAGLDHLRLMPLLRAGLAVDLPDGKQLLFGSLKPDSPWVGKMLSDRPLRDARVELIAVLRRGHLNLPQPEFVLEANDRLLLLGPATAWEELRRHLSPPPQSASP